MVVPFGYKWSVVVVVVLCVQTSQSVPTTNLPPQLPALPLTTTISSTTLTTSTPNHDSEVLEYVSTIVPLYNSDNEGENVKRKLNHQSELLIKANDSIHNLYNDNTDILTVNQKGNKNVTTSTTPEYEVSSFTLDGTTESSTRGDTDANDPVAADMTVSLLPNDTSDTTHIAKILLDAQDATKERIEERTEEVSEESRIDATPRDGMLPPQDMSTENKTREGKDSTTTDENVDGRTHSNNTEEMNGTTEALSNTGEARKAELVDGLVPTYTGRLVKCQCGATEVLTKDGCQSYPKDTFINFETAKLEKEKVRNYFSVFSSKITTQVFFYPPPPSVGWFLRGKLTVEYKRR